MAILQSARPSAVVVVDDDEAMRDSLMWLIGSCGHQAIGYASGPSYLESAAGADDPDCVILDIHMPEMSGLELYRILKARRPDLPVIFITGYPEQGLAQTARRLKAEGFFTKPLDTDALLGCLERILAPVSND